MKAAVDWVGKQIACLGVLVVATGVGIRLLVAPRVKRKVGIRVSEPRPVPRKDWGPS